MRLIGDVAIIQYHTLNSISSIKDLYPRGGGLPYETTEMLVVSLRGVNFGFWSRLGCSGQSANILCRHGLS